jgi:hypothetical protein
MKLTAFVIDGYKIDIRPAPLERDWMEATDHRYAYRCLPLNIANAYGWEILNPVEFSAVWNGGKGLDAIEVRPGSAEKPWAISHFGHGVLTFHIPCLFRTETGFDLMAQGPINRPKDAIAALAGVIETDWAPYTFTMNWKFTRPAVAVRFEAGEPFCHIFPVRRGELEAFEPRLRQLSEDADLKEQNVAWQASRRNFLVDLKTPGTPAQTERWQKLYYRGLDAVGRKSGVEDHRTRLRLRQFS